MSSTYMTWEDDDNNRQVRFRVDFSAADSNIEIVDIVPTEVSFADDRRIKVHTPKGRQILAGQISRSGRLETLKTEIAEKNLATV